MSLGCTYVKIKQIDFDINIDRLINKGFIKMMYGKISARDTELIITQIHWFNYCKCKCIFLRGCCIHFFNYFCCINGGCSSVG